MTEASESSALVDDARAAPPRAAFSFSDPAALSTHLFARALGVVALGAFGSLHVQLAGLFGEAGVLPLAPRLDAFREAGVPTLLSITGASDASLGAVLVVGELAALALALGVLPGLAAAVAFLAYGAFTAVGWPFLPLQWDALLLEALALTAIASPWDRWRIEPHALPSPHPIARLALLVLVVRLHVASGLVKVLSGDPRWLDLSALDVHFETQPLPTPLSPFVHALPSAWHAAMVLAVYALEIVLPCAALLRSARPAVVAGLLVLQLTIALTGNYGFFNVLSALLALPLLDDEQLARWAPGLGRRDPSLVQPPTPPPASPIASRLIGALAAVMIALGTLDFFTGGLGLRLPEPIADARAHVARLQLTSEYGPFGVMTTVRREIVIEVSDDGVTWLECRFRHKPGLPRDGLAFLPLHMPRLDWMLWFAALGAPEDSPWLFLLERGLLEDRAPVRALLAEVPLAQPHYARAVRYRYRFARAGEGAWTRDEREPFGPTLARR